MTVVETENVVDHVDTDTDTDTDADTDADADETISKMLRNDIKDIFSAPDSD